MKKFYTLLLVFMLLTSLFVTGCTQSAPADATDQQQSTQAVSADPVKLSVAHIFPETHPGGIYLNELSEAVSQETDGQVILEIHHNAVLGSEADEIQQIQSNNLDGALFYGISNFQNIHQELGVEELPFVFKDNAHAHRALDGEFGDAVAETLRNSGFEVLAYWENGFRHFTNNLRPIYSPQDMQGIKFRSAEIPLRLKMFALLNASAIPMGFNELYTALQQGTVDGQENPLSLIHTAKFFEVQKFLSLSGHIYNSAPLIFSPTSLGKLTDEQQDVLKELSLKMRDEQRNMLKTQNEELLGVLESNGMEINEITRDEFVNTVRPLWDEFTGQNGDDLLALIIKAE